MSKEILLKPNKYLKDDPVKGLSFDEEEVFTETDEINALAHSHTNKAVLDSINSAGSGDVISATERNKLASIDAVHYGDPLQTLAELTAIPYDDCVDKQRIYVEDELSDFFYDAQFVPTGNEDPDSYVEPDDKDDLTGAWRKIGLLGETPSSIATKYESNANVNRYTDADKAKVDAITSTGSGQIITDAERKLVNRNYQIHYHKVTATDVTNGFFSLADVPISAGTVTVADVNGIEQVSANSTGLTGAGLTPDYQVLNTNEIHINNNGAATGLSGNILEDDVLCIRYIYVTP